MFSFKSEIHEFGIDEDGDPISVNVVSDDAVSVQTPPKNSSQKLPPNVKTAFGILHDAGAAGLAQADWNEQLREVGIGVKRPAALNDIRRELKSRGLIRQYGDRWSVQHG